MTTLPVRTEPTGGSTTQASRVPGMCEHIVLDNFVSSRHSRRQARRIIFFSSVLRASNMSAFSIQLCWRPSEKSQAILVLSEFPSSESRKKGGGKEERRRKLDNYREETSPFWLKRRRFAFTSTSLSPESRCLLLIWYGNFHAEYKL